MYTALEIHVKLKYDQDMLARLSEAMFGNADGDTEIHGLVTQDTLSRMLCVDGGNSFGPSMRRLELSSESCPGCENEQEDSDAGVRRREDGIAFPFHREHDQGYIHLYVRSSYKGITHYDFIEWIKPHAIGGFVRSQYEGNDHDDTHSFGPLGDVAEEDALMKEAQEADAKADEHLPGRRYGSFDYWHRWAEGIRDAVTRMRGAKFVLPAAVVNTFVRCKDDVPRSLRHEIEKYL